MALVLVARVAVRVGVNVCVCLFDVTVCCCDGAVVSCVVAVVVIVAVVCTLMFACVVLGTVVWSVGVPVVDLFNPRDR